MARIQAPPQPGSPREAHRLMPLGTLGTYLVFGILFCVITTAGFAWLARGVFADRFVSIDDGIITWLHGYWGTYTDQLMLLLTMLGDPFVLGLLLLSVGVALLARGRWIDALGLAVAAIGAGIINELLKSVFQRVRPDLFSGPFHLTTYSFPSGHAMGSIACYGMLAFIGIRLLEARAAKIVFGAVMALLILGVGLSRIYFGVHYPTDVFGGYLAGATWLVIAIAVVQAAEWQVRRRTHQA